MKKDKNTHCLGSERRPLSTDRFYLVLSESGPWRVLLEKDYDVPDKPGYTLTLTPEEMTTRSVEGVPLRALVAQKLMELEIPAHSE